MNYLAHLFLSGNDEQTMVGNFIGDHVKGNDWEKFPENIRKGILMHRQIDVFTDSHQKFREAKALFRPEFGLYSGIIVDFLYDHFLAGNWNNYSDITLRTFAKRSHAILLQNFMILPVRVQGFLPFLIQNRRLESYATIAGIMQALKIMSNYTSLPAKQDFVMHTLQANYDFFNLNFKDFMFDIIQFITEKYGLELKNPKMTTDNNPILKMW
ncbi:MAG TPA: ACP phosphodiesterase [Draconibacterium sp.]|nr:ACP phosphodiesterase [Draconibacterium sp.]